MRVRVEIDTTKAAVILVALVLALALGGAGWFFWSGNRSSAPEVASAEASALTFDKDTFAIEYAGGRRDTFDVELAVSPEQQAYGFMDRPGLSRDAGMLFPFQPSKQVTFWMKDTRIPLDIIFMDDTGRIIKIAKQAKPFDMTKIDSEQPVRAVLELNGGEADRRGIQVGDRGVHKMFDQEP